MSISNKIVQFLCRPLTQFEYEGPKFLNLKHAWNSVSIELYLNSAKFKLFEMQSSDSNWTTVGVKIATPAAIYLAQL